MENHSLPLRVLNLAAGDPLGLMRQSDAYERMSARCGANPKGLTEGPFLMGTLVILSVPKIGTKFERGMPALACCENRSGIVNPGIVR